MFSSNKGSLVEPMVAGALTGGTQTLLFYPLDVIRARQQVDFSGKIIQDLWKGVMFSTLLTMLKRGATVVVYDIVDRYTKTAMPTLPYLQTLLAGAMAGLFEAILIQPFNVLRLRVQTERHLRTYRGALKELRMKESIFRLYNGFLLTTAGNMVWWVTCPALYRTLQSLLSRYFFVDQTLPVGVLAVPPPEEYGGVIDFVSHIIRRRDPGGKLPHIQLSKYQVNLICGLGSSFITTCLSLPLSRLASLTYQLNGVSVRQAIVQCAQEGRLSFFKGWVPTFARMVR